MTVDEFINGIDQVISELNGPYTWELLAIHGHDLAVMIAHRVLTTSTNHKGEKFSNYSTSPTYINTSTDSPKKLSPRGKTGRTVFAKTGQSHKSTYFEGGYREFRSKIGRSTDKNFELFAGSKGMWSNFDVVSIEPKDGVMVASLGGFTPKAQMKIDKNSEREGYPIILPNENELTLIEEIIIDKILELFSTNLKT